MKIIFDSNIIISAFIAQGCPKDIFALAVEKADIIISDYILDEVVNKLVKKLKFSQSEADLVLDYLARSTKKINLSKNISIDFPDAKDIPILQLAAESGAKYLITGDKLLLNKKKFNKTSIITARQALEVF